MYEPYDYGEPMEDSHFHHGKSRFESREDFVSTSHGHHKPSRWVFISRKADIGILVVLLLAAGSGIMWFISQLPFFLETASSHYQWAMEMYDTWGTPSMRWLFINLVVGVIVATSGLLSAFGGDQGPQPEADQSGYDKGPVYGGSDQPYNAIENSYAGPGFAGPGYESPLYNPYSQHLKSGLHHEASLDSWNYEDDSHVEDRDDDDGEIHESHHAHAHAHPHPHADESYSSPAIPVDAMSREIPVTREVSMARDMSREMVIPREAQMARDMPREVPMELHRDMDMSREIPREMSVDSAGDVSREMSSVPREVPISREITMPREIQMSREIPPMPVIPPRESPVTREIPVPVDAPESRDMPPLEPLPRPELPEVNHDVAPRGQEAVEIISKVYDIVPDLDEAALEHGKYHRMNTDPSIHFTTVDEPSAEASPPKPEVLSKSHTFTIGRVIRRDQLVDFIEPLSRRLEGISRKVRLDPKRNPHGEPANQSREIPAPVPGVQVAASEAGNSSAPSVPQAYLTKAETHRRRHSSETIPAIGHGQRLSSESVPLSESNNSLITKQTTAPAEIVPPPSPLLKQRSIVYPPALVSEPSLPARSESPPASPPIEEAIPPPPPPHLKLSSAVPATNPSSMTASEELPSFKFYVPPSPSSSEPLSAKHSRSLSTHIPSTSSASAGGSETGMSSVQEDRSGTVKPRRSTSGDEKIQPTTERPPLDNQENSSAKEDDLHQQIEDFLARFHENWRLQRQESLARYKKRLVELDE